MLLDFPWFDCLHTDKEHFEDFYEEIMEELSKFGELEQLNVLENLGDHMFGNVYVKFAEEEQAEAALKGTAAFVSDSEALTILFAQL